MKTKKKMKILAVIWSIVWNVAMGIFCAYELALMATWAIFNVALSILFYTFIDFSIEDDRL